ncbi:hypothetical protein C9374_011731 [Naegleria lovaniensis]|uniref:Uncharacterized protein n=1 Tax=Naegleria lovaniensis TaxID=51637 RepID=A0AA88GGU8_NAELO|nr:uncharacterized protein C9374_011731 [Naegleria lovaniensis]KAG2373846.1 hypothetical protein C9374_011731 [Naegleria lovaniensis]
MMQPLYIISANNTNNNHNHPIHTTVATNTTAPENSIQAVPITTRELQQHQPQSLHQSIPSSSSHAASLHEMPPSPLFEILAPHVEPVFLKLNSLIEAVHVKYGLYKLESLLNVLSVCLITIFCVLLMQSLYRTPVWIICLGFLGIMCGWIAMWCQDPLLMVLYSSLNAVGLVYCSTVLDYGYAAVGVSFGILLVAQFKSVHLALHYFRKRMLRKEQIIQELSQEIV